MQGWVAASKNQRRLRLLSLGAAGSLAVFVVINLVLYGIYSHKTYPNTKVTGKQLGSVGYGDLPQRLEKLDVFPKTLTLIYENRRSALPTRSLGLSLDTSALTRAVKQNPSWLPVVNWMKHRDIPLTVRVDNAAFDKQLITLADAYTRQPVDARITTDKNGFTLVKDIPGKTVDRQKSKPAILSAAARGQQSLPLVPKVLPPGIAAKDLATTFKKLEARQNTTISYTYDGKKTIVAPADKAGWYSQVNGSYTLSDAAIKAYITVIGTQYNIRVKNLPQAIAASRQALEQTKPLQFGLEGAPYVPPSKTFRYCTALRGVDASLAPELENKLTNTYADERGWSLGSLISFVHVSSGCDFTVWLSAADQMTSFGAICDSYWNCSVQRNVVINIDRWRDASDAWNTVGNNIEDYRSMAINHETGHWLGFNHKPCGGPGQPAPLMQQQSVDLQGCSFNAWPLPSEQTELRTRLQL